MRSWAEFSFRVRQEGANLRVFAFPPRIRNTAEAPAGLPDGGAVARRLRGTAFAAGVERVADSILRHEFPIFGTIVKTGPEIDWRRDYVHGVSSESRYFRRVPYLDFGRVGDHKLVWELNRHQHMVLMAQAYLLTGRSEFTAEIGRQLESWYLQNPWLRGINWASALEVAFRALSWLWVDHLAGAELPPDRRARLREGLYRHGCYLNNNLSHYFSPNTHLLGEAVALHALGAAYPQWPAAERWRRTGAALLEEQVRRQVRGDGSHFEQSVYYHVYTLDFFLLHLALVRAGGRDVSAEYVDRVGLMAGFLDALMGDAGAVPLIGDDDGGRVFHPFGARERFGRATLATAAIVLNRDDLGYAESDLSEQALWWLGADVRAGSRQAAARARSSRLFDGAGVAVMGCAGRQVVVDVGPFGEGSGGHSHSDTLSMVIREGREEILIDPGTYTYLADPAWRNLFRGSAAHNTIRVDGRDQADPAGPFRWTNKPNVKLLSWSSTDTEDQVTAECRQGALVHRRSVQYCKPGRLVVVDVVEGPVGEHLVEQFWHPGETMTRVGESSFRIGPKVVLFTDPAAKVRMQDGWRSTVLGEKTPAPVLCASLRRSLPVRLVSVVDFEGAAAGTDSPGLDDK